MLPLALNQSLLVDISSGCSLPPAENFLQYSKNERRHDIGHLLAFHGLDRYLYPSVLLSLVLSGGYSQEVIFMEWSLRSNRVVFEE
jgi:hypothetical protein